MGPNKLADEIKYSEEKRSHLYRLASELCSSVISKSSDPTEELVRIASENSLNKNEIDRVAQKANVLINEHHFGVNSRKYAEHPLADSRIAKKSIDKNSEIKKNIVTKPEDMEDGDDVEVRVAGDYLLPPDVLFSSGINYKLEYETSKQSKAASNDSVVYDEIYRSNKALETYKNAKSMAMGKFNAEQGKVASAYNSIKNSLKQAWLSGEKEALAELYVAGCMVYPDREELISKSLFKMAIELQQEGVMNREDLVKFASIPDEYFSNRNIVDSGRSVIIELDTVTREKTPHDTWRPIFEYIDDRIKYITKRINVLENTHKTIRGTLDSTTRDEQIKGQYKGDDSRFKITSEKI